MRCKLRRCFRCLGAKESTFGEAISHWI
jgi:hypothetical protein